MNKIKYIAIELNESGVHNVMSRVNVLASEAAKFAYALLQTPVTEEKLYYVYDPHSRVYGRDHARAIITKTTLLKRYDVMKDNDHGFLEIEYNY